MKPRKKVTNKRTSEYDISVDFPFSAETISKPQQKWTNQWACSGVRVTNSPVLQLTHCACTSIRFNTDTFSTERSPNYDTICNNCTIIDKTIEPNAYDLQYIMAVTDKRTYDNILPQTYDNILPHLTFKNAWKISDLNIWHLHLIFNTWEHLTLNIKYIKI
jgi:hypothetical protein